MGICKCVCHPSGVLHWQSVFSLRAQFLPVITHNSHPQFVSITSIQVQTEGFTTTTTTLTVKSYRGKQWATSWYQTPARVSRKESRQRDLSFRKESECGARSHDALVWTTSGCDAKEPSAGVQQQSPSEPLAWHELLARSTPSPENINTIQRHFQNGRVRSAWPSRMCLADIRLGKQQILYNV